MKKTGELLKKAREEKGLSLHEIGLSLKISNKVLKGIEDGDDSQLPAKTFLRGFVQSYANFLHLDTEKVLELFYEEMGSTRPKPYIRPEDPPKAGAMAAEPSPEAPVVAQEAPAAEAAPVATVTPFRPQPQKPSSSNSGLDSLRDNKATKTYLVIGIGLALVALIIFTKKMIDKYQKEAEVPRSEVAQTMEGATPVNSEDSAEPTLTEVSADSAPAAAGTLPIQTTPTVESLVSSAKPAPAASAPVSTTTAQTATTTPPPTAKPAHSEAAPAAPTPTQPAPTQATAPVAPVVTPPTPPKPEIGKPVELIVEALDPVEIEYSAPNGKPQKIRLSAEQVHTFKSKSGLRIGFSNGGAVNLILNGKEIGTPGDLGKPIKLSY